MQEGTVFVCAALGRGDGLFTGYLTGGVHLFVASRITIMGEEAVGVWAYDRTFTMFEAEDGSTFAFYPFSDRRLSTSDL